MNCTKCNSDTQITDSRGNQGNTQIRRRRKCLKCKHAFSTYERRNDAVLEQSLALLMTTLASITKEIDLVKHKIMRVQNSRKLTNKEEKAAWKV